MQKIESTQVKAKIGKSSKIPKGWVWEENMLLDDHGSLIVGERKMAVRDCRELKK